MATRITCHDIVVVSPISRILVQNYTDQCESLVDTPLIVQSVDNTALKTSFHTHKPTNARHYVSIKQGQRVLRL